MGQEMLSMDEFFARAFVEALEALGYHDLDGVAVGEIGPRWCGVYPPQDDLLPGIQWSPCDLPYGHDSAHNCGIVP